MAPKDIRSQSLEPLNVTLYGKRVFADVMKLSILGWGDYLGLSRGALNEITSILKRETEGDLADRREGNMTTKAETGKMQPKNTNSHQ